MRPPAPTVTPVTRGKLVAALVGAGLVIAITIGSWLVLRSSGDDEPPTANAPEQAQLDSIEQDVTSHELPRLRRAFGIPKSIELDARFKKAAGTWDAIEIDRSSWRSTSATTGEIAAELRDKSGETTTWTLILEEVDDQWFIQGTRWAA